MIMTTPQQHAIMTFPSISATTAGAAAAAGGGVMLGQR